MTEQKLTIEDKFNMLVKAMKRTKIPCTVSYDERGVTLQLGSGWSDRYRIYNRVDIILNRLGLTSGIDGDLCLCATSGTGHDIKVEEINGGRPKTNLEV